MNGRTMLSLVSVGILGVLPVVSTLWWRCGRDVELSDRQDTPGEISSVGSCSEPHGDCCSRTLERREELRQSFDAVANAFSNRQANVMREIFSSHVAELRVLRNSDLEYVLSGPYRAYAGEMFQGDNVHSVFHPPLDFASVEEFGSYGKVFMELVRTLGDSYAARGSYGFPKQIEAMFLRLLLEYKKKFEVENRRGLVTHVDALITEWLQHVESPQGYSRRYMHWQFAAIVDDYLSSGRTRLDAAKTARLVAVVELATFCNYTPGWADELEHGSTAAEIRGKYPTD